jgi:putative membrane protein
VEGWAQGNMVWFAIPLSLVISWMYASLDQVGEATENPFEGSANDVPITLLCEQLELDVREMLGDKGMEASARSKRGIAL